MSRSFIFRAETMADMDVFLEAEGFATFDPLDEEPKTFNFEVPVYLDKDQPTEQVFVPTRPITLDATSVRALENKVLDDEAVATVPKADVNRLLEMKVTVNSLEPYKQIRANWLKFKIDDQEFHVLDNGGSLLVPAPGVRIHDMQAKGWPLVNKKATFEKDGTRITQPEIVPGVFVVVQINGLLHDENDNRETPEDDTIFERSVIAHEFKASGSLVSYSKIASETDWGEGYTMQRYDRDVDGVTIGLVDPATVPQAFSDQHGRIRRAVSDI